MYRMGTPDRNDTPLIIGNLPKRLQEKIITRGSQNNGNDQETGSELGLAVQSNNLEATNHTLPPQHQNCDDNLKSITVRELDEKPLQIPRSVLANTEDQQKQEQPKVMGENDDGDITAIDHFLRLSSASASNATVKKGQRQGYSICNDENEVNGLLPLKNTAISLADNGLVVNSMVVPGILRLNLNDIRLLNKKENRRSNNNKKNGFRSPSKQYQQQLVQHNNRQLHHSNLQLICNNGNGIPNWFKSLPDFCANQLSSLYESLVKMISQHNVLKVIS